jgi:hypothetical protein
VLVSIELSLTLGDRGSDRLAGAFQHCNRTRGAIVRRVVAWWSVRHDTGPFDADSNVSAGGKDGSTGILSYTKCAVGAMVIARWRREHGEDFVAQVVEKESGEYEAAAWDEPSTPLRRMPRTFRHRESAKAAATISFAGCSSTDALWITAVIDCSGTRRESDGTIVDGGGSRWSISSENEACDVR